MILHFSVGINFMASKLVKLPSHVRKLQANYANKKYLVGISGHFQMFHQLFYFTVPI